jgi:hypothetical protein
MGNGQAFAGVTQELGEAVRWVGNTEESQYIELNRTEFDWIYRKTRAALITTNLSCL